MAGSHRYRPEILDALWRHGVHATPSTDPVLVRNFVRDLYKYEIRRLRERYVGGEFPGARLACAALAGVTARMSRSE